MGNPLDARHTSLFYSETLTMKLRGFELYISLRESKSSLFEIIDQKDLIQRSKKAKKKYVYSLLLFHALKIC